jgi:hypothetical protein
MRKQLYVFAAVVMLVAICAGIRRVLDERREPLFTPGEHLANFASDFAFGLTIAFIGLLVSFSAKRGK